jgi:hypothetical protein
MYTDAQNAFVVEGPSRALTGDFDGDGSPWDVYLLSVWGQNALFLQDAEGSYRAVAEGELVSSFSASYAGITGDFDNDGDSNDVCIINYLEPNQLFLQDDTGAYTAVTSGPVIERSDYSQNVISGDFDGDGDAMDLIVINAGQPNELLCQDDAGEYVRMTSSLVMAAADTSYAAVTGDFDGDGDV